jgi:hypothetical protein
MKKTGPRKPDNAKFTFGSGRAYANNDEFASKGLLFEVQAIAFEPGRGFEGRDRWALTIKTEGRESEVMSLGSNPNRDEQLRAAQVHLEAGGTIENVRLRLSGNAYYLADGPL